MIFGLLAAIILCAAGIRFHGSAARWKGSFSGWNGANYSLVARNHVRYGLARTKGLMVFTSRPDAEQLDYYLHHPPLLGLLVASQFYLWGESEFVARLLPILFSRTRSGCMRTPFLI